MVVGCGGALWGVREVLWGMKSESEGREKRFEKVSGSEIFVWRDMCDNL